MKTKVTAFILAVLSIINVSAQTNELPRTTPESENISSQSIYEMFDSLMALDNNEMHSTMVLRHGKVIAEMYPKPFAPQHRHTMYSCSKTFVGIAVGLAVSENRLRLSDRVATFFPEYLPDTISCNLASITVEDLLTMRAGIIPDWDMRNMTTEWIRTYLGKTVSQPGEKFMYDSMCTFILSAIVQKTTGMKTLDFLQSRLFSKMNISEVAWEESPDGINTGGWGLHIQSESLAKIGLLILAKGKWNGEQLVPKQWIEDMCALHVKVDEESYGYQIWLCDYPGAIRADGALGQYIIIVPEKDMVIVMTEAAMNGGKAQRKLVWNMLRRIDDSSTLHQNVNDYSRLCKKQQAYTLPYPKGKNKSQTLAIGSKITIILDKNSFGYKTVEISNSRDNGMQMTATSNDGDTTVMKLGYKTWKECTNNTFPPYSISPKACFSGLDKTFTAAGAYAWENKNTLVMKVHFVNWVTSLLVTADLKNKTLDIKANYKSKAERIKILDIKTKTEQ